MIGATLLTCLRDLRAETGQSLNVAHHTQSRDTEVYWLNRQQRELVNQYDWPHLLTLKAVPLLAGVTTYFYPGGVAFNTINHMWVSADPAAGGLPPKSARQEVSYGIDEAVLVQEGIDTPTWPPRRWQNYLVPVVPPLPPVVTPVLQFKVWPTPSKNGVVWFSCTPEIPDMVSDVDPCWIDSTAIVLFAAAEILATQKSEGAATKLQKANQYIRRLLANSSATKRRMFLLGQGDPGGREQLQPWIDYIPTSP